MDPAYGGPVEGVLSGGEALRRLGHDYEVASLDAPKASFLATSPAKIHALGPGRTSAWLAKVFPPLRYRASARFLSWLGRNAKSFDAVIVNGVWNFSSLGAWLALRRAATPYFVFTHGMLDPWFARAYPTKHRAKALFWRLLEHRVLFAARNVLFTTLDEQALAEHAFKPFPKTGVVVGYGTADAPPPAPSTLVLPPRYLLFLSRLHRKKGCDDLLCAFAEAAKAEPDLHLVMAGPDETGWRADLEALCAKLDIADRVVWTGMISGADKWAAYRGAEAFVLATHSENFGVVIAEAMACGRPVLTTNKANIWREIEASGAGLVSDDTPQAFAQCLQQFLAMSPEARSAMGAHARSCFLEHFWIDRTIAKLAATLQGKAG